MPRQTPFMFVDFVTSLGIGQDIWNLPPDNRFLVFHVPIEGLPSPLPSTLSSTPFTLSPSLFFPLLSHLLDFIPFFFLFVTPFDLNL